MRVFLFERLLPVTVLGVVLCAPGGSVQAQGSGNPYGQWENGPPSDAGFFPIGVWVQDPALAQLYKDIGINTYIALWQGPTQAQLLALENEGLSVVAWQNTVGLTSPRNHVITGWRQVDEPDNAQPNGSGGFGPCIPPAELVTNYQRFKANDATRPVWLNFGQGVSFIQWQGRGTCTGDTSYYPAASAAADILSFDIYPVTHSNPDIQGKLEFVAQGVSNLVEWSQGVKIIWNFIETTHINSPTHRPTADQIRAEVWMSLIHGSMGIAYFVHEWEPSFRADGIFRYPEIVDGVGEINGEIRSLAPVLNTPTLEGTATVSSAVPVAFMVKQYDGDTFLFAVSMRPEATTAEFSIPDLGNASANVIGEDRSIAVGQGLFQDDFSSYQVHLYRLNPQPKPPTGLKATEAQQTAG